MQQGTVKFFNEAKGFGFISPEDGSKDIFVHSSGLGSGIIRENDKVIFDIQKGERGLNAVNVKLA
ncbi:cold-shock protein [Chryseobacterium zhengzhouense]|jgi:CspA family cold shock protein|uniref:Cold-shock protein n=1 Tax=Chryseobacterium zhengzhouense TaxID=1636086 RepID=A0ABW2LXX3_9FLAO